MSAVSVGWAGHENNGRGRICVSEGCVINRPALHTSVKNGLTGFTPSRVGLRSGQFEPAKQD